MDRAFEVHHALGAPNETLAATVTTKKVATTNAMEAPTLPSTAPLNVGRTKTACMRAERAVVRMRRTVRRGTIVGALAGATSFYVADVASGFGDGSTALAYVSALPVCVVLAGLGGAASAAAAALLIPRRRHRRVLTGWCLATAAPAWLWWHKPAEADRPM